MRKRSDRAKAGGDVMWLRSAGEGRRTTNTSMREGVRLGECKGDNRNNDLKVLTVGFEEREITCI